MGCAETRDPPGAAQRCGGDGTGSMEEIMNLKGKSFSAKAGLAGAVLSLAALIAFVVYGLVYSRYFDITVLICFLLGTLLSAAYALVDNAIAEYCSLLGTLCMSFGLGLAFLNSYEVWADWWGGFTMYGSEGGVAPVILILVLALLAGAADIVSCFSRKNKEAAA